MYIRKTMVLSSLDESNQKAVLNIESGRDGLSGNVRLYNFSAEPSGILSLGILVNGKVYKAGLHNKGNNSYSFQTQSIDDLSKFSCALININKGRALPILMGSTDGKSVGTAEVKLASGISLLDDENITKDQVESVLNANNIYYDEEEQEEIDRAIDKEFKTTCEKEGEKCTRCDYRNAFFSDSRVETIEKVPAMHFDEDLVEGDEAENFYFEIKEQIDMLFERYPEDTFLTEVIPNSKWCKVDYEDNGEYYVVGIIYENDDIRYVCYGIPGIFSPEPPKELSGFCQWLPLDPDKPEDFGYWLMYQDAETGESIEIDAS